MRLLLTSNENQLNQKTVDFLLSFQLLTNWTVRGRFVLAEGRLKSDGAFALTPCDLLLGLVELKEVCLLSEGDQSFMMADFWSIFY